MTDLWTMARRELSERLSPEIVTTWFDPTVFDGVVDSALVLRVPSQFHGEWVATHYQQLILDVSRRILVSMNQPELVPDRLRIELDRSLGSPVVTPARRGSDVPTHGNHGHHGNHGNHGHHGNQAGSGPGAFSLRAEPTQRPELNPKYTFESFVVGSSNQLAHAASLASATHPGRRYNPLFLCGDVGLGKTHLVNAIGQHILANQPSARILYVSAEKFTNEFISAIKNHQMEQFRKTYRENCDVLLMDDIQFIAKRESTMEEFFHTFNALHHADKQIVVTSDVYPENLDGMEARIISRFQSGMVADIQAPDVDTRVAILEKKAEVEGIELDKNVADFVAQTVKSNVRELEGTLLRLAVQAQLLGKRMDLELARTALRASYPKIDSATTVEDIQKAVCEYYGLRLADLKSKRRQRSISFPRMLAMYLCRQHLGVSYPDLGEKFSKDHTTVMHAFQKISGLVESHDMSATAPITAIERRLGF